MHPFTGAVGEIADVRCGTEAVLGVARRGHPLTRGFVAAILLHGFIEQLTLTLNGAETGVDLQLGLYLRRRGLKEAGQRGPEVTVKAVDVSPVLPLRKARGQVEWCRERSADFDLRDWHRF